MRLIINADDFGYSTGQNLGIIEGYKHGCITSTTLLTTMPGTNQAIHLAKENPDLDVGIHLSLD
ncbi:MAG: ChbG/HpnK family deacetylase, partial [Coprobacillaceae bacterium]